MARRVDDARFWRNRADEVLILADQMKDPKCRSLLLGVAYTYTLLARHAEERDAKKA